MFSRSGKTQEEQLQGICVVVMANFLYFVLATSLFKLQGSKHVKKVASYSPDITVIPVSANIVVQIVKGKRLIKICL